MQATQQASDVLNQLTCTTCKRAKQPGHRQVPTRTVKSPETRESRGNPWLPESSWAWPN